MKLFLIGNGSIGRKGKSNELELFDKIIVEKAKKEKPNFLFIGLASAFSDSYYDISVIFSCFSDRDLKIYNEILERKK